MTDFERCAPEEIKSGIDVFVIDLNGADISKAFILGQTQNSFKIIYTETNFVEDISSLDRILPFTEHNEEIFQKQEEEREKISENSLNKPLKTKIDLSSFNQPRAVQFFSSDDDLRSESTYSDSDNADDEGFTEEILPQEPPKNILFSEIYEEDESEPPEESNKQEKQEIINEKDVFAEEEHLENEDKHNEINSDNKEHDVTDVSEERKQFIKPFNISSCDYSFRQGERKSTWMLHLRFDPI